MCVCQCVYCMCVLFMCFEYAQYVCVCVCVCVCVFYVCSMCGLCVLRLCCLCEVLRVASMAYVYMPCAWYMFVTMFVNVCGFCAFDVCVVQCVCM